MLRRMRFLFNHASLGVITAGASVFLRAGRRAGGICYGFPFAERVVCLGILRVNALAEAAFLPMLGFIMVGNVVMLGRASVCLTANLADCFL